MNNRRTMLITNFPAAQLLIAALLLRAATTAQQSTMNSNIKLVCVLRAAMAKNSLVKAGRYKALAPEELKQLVDSYMDTPAMMQLSNSYIGSVQHAKAADFYRSARAASEQMLQTCIEGGGLVNALRTTGKWAVPAVPQLNACGDTKVHLVVVTSDNIKPEASTSQHMLGSFRMRGLPLPAYMLRHGHTVSWYSLNQHSSLFDGCLLDPDFQFPFPFGPTSDGRPVVALVVKQRPDRFMQCFAKHNIPVVLDLVDNTLEYSKFKDFKLILATNRASAMMYQQNTGVRSIPLYHQPPNYAKFHRKDRSTPVRTIAMTHQRVNHGLETDMLAAVLGRYARSHNITFR